jgi:nucleoside-diphosphate-sugar epimerase
MGVAERSYIFQFREPSHLSEKEVKGRVARLQADARAALKARGRAPKLQVLLTGATGFLGKEILVQAADDRNIAQMVCALRPEKIRDHKTKEVVKVLSPQQRGAQLLHRLGITGVRAKKFRFVDGDIEKPNLGIPAAERAKLEKTLTHIVHCAASVSCDDTYENSYRANVLGARNALELAHRVQNAKGSSFINHIAIETSYIHGRKKRSMALENALAFPRAFYNNYYELTKAMASIDTDRFMIEKGLRVAQLLPSIVIGHSRTGNNYGDTKVVNAPINAFGRSKDQIDKLATDMVGRSKARMIAAVAMAFPGDATAELNLVPVDRVVAGIIAALVVPEAIGERIHLATDNRIRTEDIVRITKRGDRHRRPPYGPDAVPATHAPAHEDRAREDEGAQARERARQARRRSSAATASGASPSTTSATTCASWASPSAAPTRSSRSACSAGTTSSCRTSAR